MFGRLHSAATEGDFFNWKDGFQFHFDFKHCFPQPFWIPFNDQNGNGHLSCESKEDLDISYDILPYLLIRLLHHHFLHIDHNENGFSFQLRPYAPPVPARRPPAQAG
jgi:hypothetical protein